MTGLQVATWFVEAIMEKCDGETARSIADSVLDDIEDYVTGTKNKLDDLLKPLIKKTIREPFGIPDNDNQQQAAEGSDEAEGAGGDTE